MSRRTLHLGNVHAVTTRLDEHRRTVAIDPVVRMMLTTDAGHAREVDLTRDEAVALAVDLLDAVRTGRQIAKARNARNAHVERL